MSSNPPPSGTSSGWSWLGQTVASAAVSTVVLIAILSLREKIKGTQTRQT